MSAAPSVTGRPCSRSFFASLPIVVVLPVPLTPTTRITAGSCATSSVARLAEERGDLLGERARELGQVLPRLEAPDQLGGRAHADVGVDQRLLEPLPRRVVLGIEGRDDDLLGERTPRLAERFAQAAEETAALLVGLGARVRLAQQL